MARKKQKTKGKKKVTLFSLWGSGILSTKEYESRTKEQQRRKDNG